MQNSFDTNKSLLLSSVPLAHPDTAANIVMAADAFDTHIGDILQHKEKHGWRP